MRAEEFLAAQRALLQEKAASPFWRPEELEAALRDAVRAVQADLPVFFERHAFETEPGTGEYGLPREAAVAVALKIGGEAYELASHEAIAAAPEGRRLYAVAAGRLFVRPVPDRRAAAEFFYRPIVEQEAMAGALVLPPLYHEALRRYFLFRVFEKDPDRKSRQLASYYLRLYEEEVRKRRYLDGTRPRSVRSGYRRV